MKRLGKINSVTKKDYKDKKDNQYNNMNEIIKFRNLIDIKFKDIVQLKLPSYVIAAALGSLIMPIGKSCGLLVGKRGVNYYGEMHLSPLNRYIHTVGMPFTIYGITQWLPLLFKLNPRESKRFLINLYILYLSHYFTMDWKIGIMYAVTYTPIVAYSILKHYNIYNENKFKSGALITVAALIFQEIVGHYFGGDGQSRIEGVPNAILYAKYFSLYHIIYFKNENMNFLKALGNKINNPTEDSDEDLDECNDDNATIYSPKYTTIYSHNTA
jgi:uncharacterized membrane protein YGL010W